MVGGKLERVLRERELVFAPLPSTQQTTNLPGRTPSTGRLELACHTYMGVVPLLIGGVAGILAWLVRANDGWKDWWSGWALALALCFLGELIYFYIPFRGPGRWRRRSTIDQTGETGKTRQPLKELRRCSARERTFIREGCGCLEMALARGGRVLQLISSESSSIRPTNLSFRSSSLFSRSLPYEPESYIFPDPCHFPLVPHSPSTIVLRFSNSVKSFGLRQQLFKLKR